MALSKGSKVFLVLTLLAVSLVGGGLVYVDWLLSGDGGDGEPISVEVEQGATAASIGEQLEELGVVRSALAFRLVARSRSLDSQLQAGTYELAVGSSVDEAIDGLLEGPAEPETYRFRVEEGLSVQQTLERLAQQTPYTVEEFRAILDQRSLALPQWVPDLDSFGPEVREPYEGLLFPQTYEVFADTTAEAILQRMVDELIRIAGPLVQEHLSTIEAVGLTPYEALVLASLVERETQVDGERPTVAGVIYNRLEIGMLLQIDATVLYALGEHKDRVLNEDLEVESPYNTYRVAGLPPTPISGMGAAALAAAYQPEAHTFFYYVLAPDCTANHVFSETLNEHNRNVARYRDRDCG